MDVDTTPRLLGLDEVLVRLRIKRSTAYQLMAEGRLPARKLGRRILFLEEDVNSFIQALPPAAIGRGRAA